MERAAVDFTYMQNTVWQLKAKHPVIRVKRIGKSVVGRSIYALELGRETAPGVLYAGTFLGIDRVSGPILLRWLERLAQGIESHTLVAGIDPVAMLSDRKMVIIPFVNPDGREICERGSHCAGVDGGKIRRLSGGDTNHWAANARGVDITANFDFRFAGRCRRLQQQGVFGPGAKGYPGPCAESEPETVALTGYCKTHSLRHGVCLYPGNGQILWRSENAHPLCEQMGSLLGLVGGYDTEASVGCMVDTGFRNWFCHTFHKPAVDIMLSHKVCREETPAYDELLEEMLTVAALF